MSEAARATYRRVGATRSGHRTGRADAASGRRADDAARRRPRTLLAAHLASAVTWRSTSGPAAWRRRSSTRDGEVIVRDRVSTPARNVWPALTQLVGRVLAANPGDVEPPIVRRHLPGTDRPWTGADEAGRHADLARLPDPSRAGGPSPGCTSSSTRPGGAWRSRSCGAASPTRSTTHGTSHDGVATTSTAAFVPAASCVQGLTGNLGQFGHLIVEPDGMQCACGGSGCLTTYAGARGTRGETDRELRRTPASIVERTGIMVARAWRRSAAMLDVSRSCSVRSRAVGVRGAVLRGPRPRARPAQRSGHLAQMRVRGVSPGRIGPLVAAAAVAATVSSPIRPHRPLRHRPAWWPHRDGRPS